VEDTKLQDVLSNLKDVVKTEVVLKISRLFCEILYFRKNETKMQNTAR